MKISDQDLAILREVQRDGTASLAELAARVGMAQSTVWRRMQDLAASGVITRTVAVLDPSLVDVKLCVLASVSLKDHSDASVSGFVRIVDTHPEILECHKVSGQADYMLKVRVADVEAYEVFMTHALLRSPFVQAVQSSFVLKEVKSTTELPI